MGKKKKKTGTRKKRRTRRSLHPAGLKDPLIFIDTNILLDFYRARNDQSFSLLERIDEIRNRVITTSQVEMEFKKNRQTAILESLKNLSVQDRLVSPAFLRDSQAAKTANKKLLEAASRAEALRRRIKDALHNPTQKDPVYQTAQRLFNNSSTYNLNRCNEEIYERRRVIRRAALKRFSLGYPPRKNNDTSVGDAVNWEWAIECARTGKADIIVVSRDSDYGITLDKESFINDWLQSEFRSRVSAHGQVRLTARLSTALKWLAAPVTDEEIAGEETLIATASRERSMVLPDLASEARAYRAELMKWIQELAQASISLVATGAQADPETSED